MFVKQTTMTKNKDEWQTFSTSTLSKYYSVIYLLKVSGQISFYENNLSDFQL